jgi:4,5-dihydroxyphthalate decarboxylase
MLSIAVEGFGHTRALLDGSIQPDGFTLDPQPVSPIIAAYRLMVRERAFDICEMAATTYLVARSFGKRFTALPIFLTRIFHHDALVYHADQPISDPHQLEGQRVGVRAYTVTTGVWTRGLLQHEYGVDISRVTWVTDDEEHVEEFRPPSNVVAAPPGVSLAQLLGEGSLVATFKGNAGAGRAGPPRADWTAPAAPEVQTRPLFPNARAADADWLQRTGITPIHALIVVKDEVLDANPALPMSLYAAFSDARDRYLEQLRANGPHNADDERWLDLQSIVGSDPLPYGIRANRSSLEALVRYAAEQHVIPEIVPIESLFASATRDT